ncbi:MAG: tetratricopeptide repeat protein [Candidatus Omnitrophica bacterium]|nr:tetratricopeptide repeat protein [Candidatus Omnitrophota bacterium]
MRVLSPTTLRSYSFLGLRCGKVLLCATFLVIIAFNSFAKDKNVISELGIPSLGLVKTFPEDVESKTEKPTKRPRRINARVSAKAYSNYLRGLFLAEEGNYKKALKELRKVKKLDPKSVHIRLKIAAFLIRSGEMEKAEKELQSAKKIDSEDIDVSLALIFLHSYTQNDEALEKEYGEFLERAHKVKPENIKISEYLAQFYFYKRKPQDAIRVYEAIIEANPGYVEGLFWLGYLYAEVGRRKEAIDIWIKGLDIEPAHAPTLNSLGYTYAEDEVKLDEAEEMIKKALEKDPQNGAYLDSLAWVYFKKKEYELAEAHLLKAVQFLKDPILYEHLGDVCLEAGKIENAGKYYQEGVKYFPKDKKLQEKLKKHGKKSKINKK